jgi:hypothetical protein
MRHLAFRAGAPKSALEHSAATSAFVRLAVSSSLPWAGAR